MIDFQTLPAPHAPKSPEHTGTRTYVPHPPEGPICATPASPETSCRDRQHERSQQRPQQRPQERHEGNEPRPARTHFLHSESRQILTETCGVYGDRVWQIHPYRNSTHVHSRRVVVNDATPELLQERLASRRWRPAPITFAGAPDCYQPIERQLRLTRRCLEILAAARNPVVIHTSSDLILRDLDLLTRLARRRSVQVYLAITTLDNELAERLEPGGTPPTARLQAIRRLADAGIPTSVVAAPILPGLNDSEIPAILGAAAQAGAQNADWHPGGLPHEVDTEFWNWLRTDRPMMEKKVSYGQQKRSGPGGKKGIGRDRCAPTANPRAISSPLPAAWATQPWNPSPREDHAESDEGMKGSETAAAADGHGSHLSPAYLAQVESLFTASSKRYGLDQPLPLLDAGQFRRPTFSATD